VFCIERVINYHSQHFVDVDGSADKPRWIMSEAHQMRKLHPAAALAESQTQDGAVETVHDKSQNNNNCVDDENDGDDDDDDDDDDVVFRHKNSSSSSRHSSGGLDGACRRLITGKDAANRRAADWLSLAWRNKEKNGVDSATSVDDCDNVPHAEQENSRRVDDAADCSCCDDAVHTTDEV